MKQGQSRIKIFFKNLLAAGFDVRNLAGIKICAIGEKTAQSIFNYGIKVDKVPAKFVAEEVVKMFTKEEIKDKYLITKWN